MSDPKYPMANAKKTGMQPSATGPSAKFDQPLGQGSDPGVTAFSDKDMNAVEGNSPHHNDKRDADWSVNHVIDVPAKGRPD